MMFNLPLPGGTTGHAVGGTLVAVMPGPEAACLAVSVALALQAVLALLTPLGLIAEGDAWGEWDGETLQQLAGLSSVPAGMAQGFSFEALLPDYSLAGLPEAVGYVLSAVVGVSLLVIAFKLLASVVGSRGGGGARNVA